MPERKRFFFNWCLPLSDYSSGRLVGIIFIRVPNRGGWGGRARKHPVVWTCKNSPLFSGSPKRFAAKADFVLCLASHFHTTRQFLHFYIFTILYNGCLLPFYNPLFSLSQRYLLSLAKEQIDNTAAFSPSQRKTWRSRVFSLLKELEIFLTSQGIGDFSQFTFFYAHREIRGKSPQAAFEESAKEFEKAFQCLIPTLRLCEGKVETFQISSSFPDSRKEKSDGQRARNTQNIFDKSM